MKIVSYKYQNHYGCGYIKGDNVYTLFNGNLSSLNNFIIDFHIGTIIPHILIWATELI